MKGKALGFKIKMLSLIFDFIKANLDSLSAEEKRIITQNLLALILGPFEFKEDSNARVRGEFIKEFSEAAFEKARIAFGESNINALYGKTLFDLGFARKIQRDLKTFIFGIIQGIEAEKKVLKGVVDVSLSLISEGGTFQLMTRAFPLSQDDSEEFIKRSLLCSILTLLEGLPITSIKECGECGRLFLNVTKRRKVYCSPNCTWKVLARKRREELKKHPRKYKAYLKKQKEIMRRKYEEKRKAELGPNVKVKRRKEG